MLALHFSVWMKDGGSCLSYASEQKSINTARSRLEDLFTEIPFHWIFFTETCFIFCK